MSIPETARWVACDFETTGLHPEYHHRAVEIALVTGTGQHIEDEWSTLLCPDRDIGASDIHGLTGVDLKDAPHFAEVVGDVVGRLRGRAIVAHNARFDKAFMDAEMRRCGIQAPPGDWLCTLSSARAFGSPSGRLADCCAYFQIDFGNAHSALDDARACAELAIRCAPADQFAKSWGTWPVASSTRAAKPRSQVAERKSSPLAALVLSRGMEAISQEADGASYVDLLDRVLEDRIITSTELHELEHCAKLLGLSGERMDQIHAAYLAALWDRANADNRVTPRELADLTRVAELLGIDIASVPNNTSAEPAETRGSDSLVGMSVCFTGALTCELQGQPITRAQAERLAREAGLLPQPRVTKKLDLLVVADPDSLSGKARKARDDGIRIVAETQFWPLIGVSVS